MKLLYIITCILLVQNCVSQSNQTNIEKTQNNHVTHTTKDQSKALDNYVDSIIKEYTIFGGSVAILKNNQVVYQRYFGESNLESHAKINEHSLFQIFSTTKIFSSVIVHKLIQEQKLSLEDSITKYIKDLPKDWQHVKVKHLLTHSSGLPDIRFYSNDSIAIAKEKLYQDPIQFQPGQRFAYNQTNYWLLNEMVKTITKTDITNLITDTQFTGQDNSVVFNGHYASLVPNRAITYAGYGPEGIRETAEYNIAEFLYSASGLNISLNAFIAWDQSFSEEKIINNKSKNELYKPFNYQNPHDFAHGWDIVNINSEPSYGFTGSGFTGYRKFPNKNLTVILLTNGSMQQMPINGFINQLAELATSSKD